MMTKIRIAADKIQVLLRIWRNSPSTFPVGNVKWLSHFETIWQFLKSFKRKVTI